MTMEPHSRRAFLRASTAAMGAVLTGGAGVLAGCETKPPPSPATGFPLIADTATRLDAAKAAGLRKAGVKTVFRYYCHLPASIPGKELAKEEARLALDHGLSLAAVFQHYNNCWLTFENNWGREDARQALKQAEAVGQPEGSAIYFGVDGDWPYQSMVDAVLAYFEDVNQVMAGKGIDVGVYSNGCLCNAVVGRGLASYAWISGSTAHTGTQAYYNEGGWSLYQNALDIRVGDGDGGLAIDTSLANPGRGGYFGQFDGKGARSAAHTDADTRGAFAARRFTKAATDIKAAPDASSATLGTVRKDLNVRVVDSRGPWTRVITQEGGARASGPALDGWTPAAALAALDRFPDGGAYGVCGSSGTMKDAQKYASCEKASSRRR